LTLKKEKIKKEEESKSKRKGKTRSVAKCNIFVDSGN